MEAVMGVVDYILNMGPSVVMPIILFVMCLFFRIEIGKAIRSSLTVGMAFIGINMVLGLLTETLSPVTEAMVENTGVDLAIMDVGWPAISAISLGTTKIVPWIFVLGIITNGIMLAMKWTKTLYIDLWNYWHFIFTSAFVYAATDNFLLAIALGILTEVIVLKVADWTAPMVQDFYDLPGVSLPHTETVNWAPVTWGINRVLGKIPVIKDIEADPEYIQKKYGALGEPLVVGTIIGIILGILGYGPNIAAQETNIVISNIIETAITLGAVLLIFPKMVGLLMDGLVPISDGVQEFLSERFSNRDLYIGLDGAILAGHPANVATAYLLVPITIIIAVLLNFIGLNQVLPFADLAVLPILVIWAQTWGRGNIFRGVLNGAVMIAAILIIATFLAPMTTELAAEAGFDIPKGSQMISSLDGGAHLIPWVLSVPFIWDLVEEYGVVFVGASLFILLGSIASYVVFIYRVFTTGLPEINAIKEKESGE